MAGFLIDSVVKFLALHDQLDQAWNERPVAALIGRPKIPVGIENVCIVIVDEVGSDYNSLFRFDARREAALQYASFIPRDWLHSGVGDAGALLGKRELLQDGEHMRQHRWAREIWKPETQIEGISHKGSERTSRIIYCKCDRK